MITIKAVNPMTRRTVAETTLENFATQTQEARVMDEMSAIHTDTQIEVTYD